MMSWSQNFAYPYLGMHIHSVFAVMTFLGIVLFLIWAFRVLDKKKMFTWAISLLAIGLVGAVLTSEMGGSGFEKMRDKWGTLRCSGVTAQTPAK